MLITQIKSLAKENFEEIRNFRRVMHQNPELSFKEFETQKRIQTYLEGIGITNIETCATTGLVALIEGKNPKKKTVALRADIDALPIREENNTSYSSQNDGVMHACGHDVHTSCLLGAAKILYQLRSEFEGTIKLVIQPGEEKLPGGASIMIKEGVLNNPEVDAMIGQHVMPLIDAGKVGFRKGLYMASADEIYITIHGKGGHGAHPHLNIDPVAIAAQVITGLQQIVSRSAKPAMPSVLSIGKIVGLGATNIIPDKVEMEGTFRTFNEEWRMEAHSKIEAAVKHITTALGGTCDVEVRKGYPFLYNNNEKTENAKQAAIAYLGAENVEELDIWPAGEDFAYFSQQVPSCFYRLGIRNESEGITSMLHTPTFDIDEKALEVGVGLMAYTAICELGAK
ncbi:MAG: amidohydrolase [Bacteroidetes bacterium]|jgi:amidohydrolase|nr:amidohydrolase [Bacteroidota bacterium]